MTLSSLSPNASRDTEGVATPLKSAQKICPQTFQPSLLQVPVKEAIPDKKMECVVEFNPRLRFLQKLLSISKAFSCLDHSKLALATEDKELLKAVHVDDMREWSRQTVVILMIPLLTLYLDDFVYLHLWVSTPSASFPLRILTVPAVWKMTWSLNILFSIFKGNFLCLVLYILTWHLSFHSCTVFLRIWAISRINHQLRITEQTHVYTCKHTNTHTCTDLLLCHGSLSCITSFLSHFASYAVSFTTCLLKTLRDGKVLFESFYEITPIIDMIPNWSRMQKLSGGPGLWEGLGALRKLRACGQE